jgi:hypothetical protein
LAPVQVLQSHGHGVGRRQRELQIIGIGHPVGPRRVEMYQAEDFLAAADWGANHTGCVDFALAVAAAERAVAHDIARQHRFALSQDSGCKKGRNAMVGHLGVRT